MISQVGQYFVTYTVETDTEIEVYSKEYNLRMRNN